MEFIILVVSAIAKVTCIRQSQTRKEKGSCPRRLSGTIGATTKAGDGLLNVGLKRKKRL